MNGAWPPEALDAFARSLPFEHMLRRRSADEAFSRWRVEFQAYGDAAGVCVGMVISCCGDAARLRQTIATCELQTWRHVAVVVVGKGTAETRPVVDDVRIPCRMVERLDEKVLSSLGIDWVVSLDSGDLVHPSLAGVVAIHASKGVDAVAWDWFLGSRREGSIAVHSRHRGPWRDRVADFIEDTRGRAFAVSVKRWRDSQVAEAWEVRKRMRGGDVMPHFHPEPLAIYFRRPGPTSPDVQSITLDWGVPFGLVDARVAPSRTAASISVVILFRDRPEMTIKAIDSVMRQRFSGSLDLVLVDNQSSLHSRSLVEARLAGLPAAVTHEVVDYDAPFNHSRQCNLAASRSTAEVLLFLNNDVELLDDVVLDQLSRWALVPGVSTVGVRMVDGENRPAGGGFRARRLPGAEFNSPVEEDRGPMVERTRMTLGNTFACAAIRLENFLAAGGLDEVEFPVGYNDVDFCLRVSGQGWSHVNVGSVRATHAVGATRARTDEIVQKLRLRCTHPWLFVRALQEYEIEPIELEACLAPLQEHVSLPGGQ